MKKTVEYVTAYKGQLTQRFTRKSWEVMGTDKCGWALVPEVPKELLDKFKNRESEEDAKVRSELADAQRKEILVVDEEDGSVTFPMFPTDEQAAQISEEIEVINKRRKRK